ncbi:MAG: DUF4832 domain-containing protein [Clostridia bacterium]|jgi:hypothetical protein|nr:DUF4832 domain-containing protein [Clostridia bacterium]
MKNKKCVKKAVCLITALVAACCAAALSGCAPRATKELLPQGVRQEIDGGESLQKIDNPDQGFYRPIYVKVTTAGAIYNQNSITDETRLYHLRMDISAFSHAVNNESDMLLTDAALQGIGQLLATLREKDKNAIIRFAYAPSFGEQANKEPALQTVLLHIAQVCDVLNAYESTVTAIEAGLIGPWGEMHTSAMATAENITAILNAFLTNTENLPILARTPQMLYDYLHVTRNDLDDCRIEKSDKAYRLGIYNDGYLGSDTDLGTFADRKKEVAFLGEKVTDHLPYGGEVVVPDSALHDIENCVPEMKTVHLSYLNAEWNDRVIDKWKNTYYSAACGNESDYYGQTAFAYIANRMGYRFLLQESVFAYAQSSDTLHIRLRLQNAGFGNLTKTKRAQIVFVNADGAVCAARAVQDFAGQLDLSYSVALGLPHGDYTVYLCMFGEEIQESKRYCVRFANNDIWNDAVGGNKIGHISV